MYERTFNIVLYVSLHASKLYTGHKQKQPLHKAVFVYFTKGSYDTNCVGRVKATNILIVHLSFLLARHGCLLLSGEKHTLRSQIGYKT